MKTLSSLPIKKVYAIRTGNIVEVRVSRKPIRKLVSKLTQTIEKEGYEYVHIPEHPYPVMQKTKKMVPFVMKQAYFVGGVLLGMIKSPNFERAMGMDHVLPKDTVVELSPTQAKKILEYDWEKRA